MLSFKNIISITILLLATSFLFVISCGQDKISDEQRTEQLTDSLIQVQKINDVTVLVSFGADAVTAINTKNGIVVIDAGISTYLTKKYKRIIAQEFNNQKFVYLINTHSHHDHNRGNSVFDEAKIIGHISGLDEIDKQWNTPNDFVDRTIKIVKEYDSNLQNQLKNSKDWIESFTQKIRYQSALSDAESLISIRKPDVTFHDSLVITVDDIRFEMKYFGGCHSNSDILIFVPQLNLLFTGDLMFQYGKPSIASNTLINKELWKSSIHWIQKRMNKKTVIIGGHGQLLSFEDLTSFNKQILQKSQL
jgi:glyoxylase-like metal-dependent hydrolase (beta-lactamase superfamily II)